MSLTYGYGIKDGEKVLELPVQVSKILSPLVLPGTALIVNFPFCAVSNIIPIMLVVLTAFSVQHIPSWVPYFSYKPLVQIVRKQSQRIRNEPIEFVKNALVCGDHALNPSRSKYSLSQHNGTAVHSLASKYLQELEGLVGSELQKEEEIVKAAMGSIYQGEALYSCIGFMGLTRPLFSRFRNCVCFLIFPRHSHRLLLRLYHR